MPFVSSLLAVIDKQLLLFHFPRRLICFYPAGRMQHGEQKHSQKLQLLEVSDWSADDLAASPPVVRHVPALTGRGWSCIYKQSPVFGQAKECHMDGGRSGALV